MKNRVIVWRITQDCNMRCRFCSYSCDVDRQRDDASIEEISQFIEVLGRCRSQRDENILVSWIGGEPFIRKDIMDYSKRLYSMGIDVSATTNGILLTEDLLTEIADTYKELVFSIDSFKECDDDVRQCNGHFEIVCDKIRALDRIRKDRGSDIRIKVNTILMRRNIAEFERFCDFLCGIGVDEITFNRLGGYDRPEFFGDNRLLYEQSEKFAKDLPALKQKFLTKGFIIHGSPKYMERFMSAALDEPNPIEECNPASWFWFVNENGYISPCSYTSYEYKYAIKDVCKCEDFDKVEEYFRKQRKCNRSKWCDDCFCTQVYDKFE